MSNQKGFVWLQVLLIILAIVVVGGGYWYIQKQSVAALPSALQTATTTQNQSTASTTSQSQARISKSYCTADNYSVRSGVEYWGENPLASADPATFKPLPPVPNNDGSDELCLAEDASHVFVERDLVLPRPDHITYLPLQGTNLCNAFRVIDGLGVFWGVWLLPGADPKNFVDITAPLGHGSPNDGDCYGKDEHAVYLNQNLISKDVSSFTVLYGRYSKDSQNVYYDGSPILGADPKTFTALYFWWAKDAHHAYQTNQVIHGADPTSFTMLDEHHAKDSGHVYNFFGQPYPEIDGKTAVSIDNGTWLKDASHVYWADGTIVPQADPQTFVGLGGGYGKDANHIFYTDGEDYGSRGHVVLGADLATFAVEDGYAKDATHIFSAGTILSHADVRTFQRIGSSVYFKDAKYVWYMSIGLVEIPGADPDTFVVTDENGGAKDADHIYGFDAKGRFGSD